MICSMCKADDNSWSSDASWQYCLSCTSKLARIGMVALVDEATGYQYERPNDNLRNLAGEATDTGGEG